MQALSKRLSAVASLVGKGARLVDVGTDHGYIPVHLVKSGIAVSAIAVDINEKPLSSCKALVLQEALCDLIDVRLSDGLASVRPEEYDTVIIAGMGGELIAEILSSAQGVFQKHIILNPMTHPELARKYLYDNGFEIQNDIIVREGRHYYSVFDARYSGSVKPHSRADYYLGEIKDFTEKGYFEHLLSYLKNKEKSGESLEDIIKAVEEKL